MLVLLYLVAIVAANLSVAYFGPYMTIVNSFLFVGLDFTTRDALHERWQNNKLWLRMFVLIAAGSAISYLLNRDAAQIAIASTVAFGLAAIADTIVYTVMHGRDRMVKINGSNVVSSAVDSLVFPMIAFGGFMPVITLGQFAAKIVGGYIWAKILQKTIWK